MKLQAVYIDGKAYLREVNPFEAKGRLIDALNAELYNNFEQSVKPILCLFPIAEGETVEESEVYKVGIERKTDKDEWQRCVVVGDEYICQTGWQWADAYELKGKPFTPGRDEFPIHYKPLDDLLQSYGLILFADKIQEIIDCVTSLKLPVHSGSDVEKAAEEEYPMAIHKLADTAEVYNLKITILNNREAFKKGWNTHAAYQSQRMEEVKQENIELLRRTAIYEATFAIILNHIVFDKSVNKNQEIIDAINTLNPKDNGK